MFGSDLAAFCERVARLPESAREEVYQVLRGLGVAGVRELLDRFARPNGDPDAERLLRWLEFALQRADDGQLEGIVELAEVIGDIAKERRAPEATS
ncbi:MAG: hypothetical protein KC544_07495 [Gemmatimonadetes bacterium]|nr:hypothetical protein [Gemmatimonadota bacterium]